MSDGVYAAIGTEGKQVVIAFSQDAGCSTPANISRWIMDAEQCISITQAMADAAFQADTSIKPVGPTLKATLVEQHRMKLTARFALMLNTLRHNPERSDGQIAQSLVDAALSEIF